MTTLRAACRDDAGAIASLHVRSWQAAYRGLMPDQYLDGLRAEDRVGRYNFSPQEGPCPRCVVAEEDGAIIGFAMRGPSRDGEAVGELYAIYVDPEHWGQGTGALLMGDSRRSLHAQGYGEAVLWVLDGNERAQRFYRADGWWPDGARKLEQVWGLHVAEVRFRRALP